jgi:hypothetical protein
MDKMTLKEFRPDGVTELPYDCECDSLLKKKMFYGLELAGPEGARFWLFKEKHHTKEDIKIAKGYLKYNHDVVGTIKIIEEKIEPKKIKI